MLSEFRLSAVEDEKTVNHGRALTFKRTGKAADVGDKLLALLPPDYRRRDESGDLAAFLGIPGASLDELKG